jgi:hypothetical protein
MQDECAAFRELFSEPSDFLWERTMDTGAIKIGEDGSVDLIETLKKLLFVARHDDPHCVDSKSAEWLVTRPQTLIDNLPLSGLPAKYAKLASDTLMRGFFEEKLDVPLLYDYEEERLIIHTE